MESLLDLDFSQWNLVPLFIIPALINFGLFTYAITFLSRGRINWTYSLFVFLCGITQFADGMTHFSSNIETAALWTRISFSPWIFITPIGILFVLSFGKQAQLVRKAWLYVALFVPAIILELLYISQADGQFEMFFDNNVRWMGNPVSNALNYVIYAMIAGGILLMPVVLWSNYFQSSKNTAARKKFLLLAVGISVPYIGGLVGELIFPLVMNMNSVPIITPLLTFFSICSLVAIKKYNMLDYSPRNQWDRILESLREGVLIADNDRKIMYANPAICHMLDYKVEDLIGKEVDKFVLNNSLRGTAFDAEREFQMATKTGELIWVVTNLAPCLDQNGKRIGSIWTIVDVDNLKKKTIAIKHSENRLNRSQEVAHVGHWEYNFASGVAIWSSETCRIYGLSPTDNVQSFEKWLSLIHPEDLPAVILEVQHANETLADSDFEHRILLPDGTVKYLRSIAKFVFDGAQTKPVSIYGVCQDITEIKTANERLRVTSRELETYIYKSSHDLHAPLSSILGLINLGRKEIKDPVAAQYLAMIEGQAKKLDAVRTDFIKAMLIKDAAKFDEQVCLNKLISEILENLKDKHCFERINVNLCIPDSEPLMSNSFLIKTILHNLIENSIKYQDHNQAKSTLDINVERQDKGTKIVITDNGVGIAPEHQDRIFDMYFRANESSNGSGLGLYLVKKAVDRLNGKVQLRSHPGEGTTVTVVLAQAS